MGRYQACVDLHLILRDGHSRILLGERQNTGWADGQLGLPSGHLEDDESASTGAAREAEEEIGVLIKADELRLVHLMHHRTNSGRVALFFEARSWSGEITNTEPDKCAGWDFYDLADLPANVVPYVAEALRHVAAGQRYSERGF
ncbi:NUDIX domain-containing protein [Micromonospora sp. NPDC002575]|uniref:NUDIX hydrolase n=1 Tax=Micromonospora sp. NPDC002575 TaxID=3364222 RepID=UPI003692B25E